MIGTVVSQFVVIVAALLILERVGRTRRNLLKVCKAWVVRLETIETRSRAGRSTAATTDPVPIRRGIWIPCSSSDPRNCPTGWEHEERRWYHFAPEDDA